MCCSPNYIHTAIFRRNAHRHILSLSPPPLYATKIFHFYEDQTFDITLMQRDLIHTPWFSHIEFSIILPNISTYSFFGHY